MKKIFLGLIAAAALMTACDPECDDKSLDLTNYSSDDLANCVTFKVYKDEACTEEAGPAEGSYVKYTTSPATNIAVLNKAADGSDNLLAHGATGTFKLSPKRGSSNDQVLTVRVVNTDNSVSETEKTVSVWVKEDLDPEYKLLLGESGTRMWTWNEDGNCCWGNAGNAGGGAGFTATSVDSKWWGVNVASDLYPGQSGHCAGDEDLAALDAQSGSYMLFDEDGNITSYTSGGSQIRKSAYKLEGFNIDKSTGVQTRTSGWALGTLTTDKPAVLWPYSINENGKQVTTFDVMYLDGNYMTLVYTKGNASGSWGEITYWRFKSMSASAETLEGTSVVKGKASSRAWTWNSDGNGCWGNAGNSGNGAGFTNTSVDGKWWGVNVGSELVGQLNHSGGVDYGDAADDAYMIFSDGKVTSYMPDGTKIRGGNYELNIYADGRANNWELGKLTTSEPALLFPWSINEGGKSVTEFDIMYMDANSMTLVYTKGNGSGSWAEITYWRFAVK